MLVYGTTQEVSQVIYRDPTTGYTVTLQSNASAAYSANRTLSLPNLNNSDTLVSLTSSDTLKNKILDSSNALSDSSDTTKQFIWSLSGATTGKALTLSSSHTNARTWTLQDSSDTFVGRATTDSLTNKTFNSTSTMTGVRMASFTPDGVNTLTAPAVTDTLVGKATTDTLTNKTLTAPVLSSYADYTEIASPGSPGAGVLRVYSKSGNGLYIKDSGGTESQLASTTTASPTVAGIVTSYFPTIQSAVKTVSSANYNPTTTDGYEVILFSTGGSDRTSTLPAPASNTGRRLLYKKTDSGTGKVTISPNASETIDGASSYVIPPVQYASVALACDGTNWFITDSTGAVTPWKSFTMVIGATTSAPSKASSPTTDVAMWRRVGDSIEITYAYYQTSSTGTAGGTGTYLWTLPNSYTIDTTKLSNTSDGSNSDNIVGHGTIEYAGSSNTYSAFVRVQPSISTTAVILASIEAIPTSLTDVGSTNRSISGNATLGYFFRFTVPVTQFVV